MGPAAQAVIDIDLEGDDASAELRQVSKAIDAFAARAEQAMYAVGAVVAVDQIRDVAVEMLDVFTNADKAARRLNTTLETTGNTTGLTSAQLAGMRASVSEFSTTTADEMAAVQNIFARTRVMSGDIFIDATQTAMDFAAAMGTDVTNAAEELSEAMVDPANELEKFRRFGITFTDQEKKMLTQLQTTGRGMEAQRYVLDRLNDVVGGQAQAAFESFGGQQEALGNKVDRLKGILGGMLAEALEPLFPVLNNIVDTCIAWLPVIEQVAVGAVNASASILGWIPTLDESSSAVMEWAGIVQSVFENWDKYIAIALLSAGASVVAFATDVQHYFTDSIPTYAKSLFIIMKDIFFQLDDIIGTVIGNIAKNIEDFWAALKAVMNGEMPSFTPTNLLEGFELKLSELPAHTAKQMSETEKVMRQAADDLSMELGTDIVAKTEVQVKAAEEQKAQEEIQNDLPEKALTLGTSDDEEDPKENTTAGSTTGLTELADQISAAAGQERLLKDVVTQQIETNKLLASAPEVNVDVAAPIVNNEGILQLAEQMRAATDQVDLVGAVQGVASQQRETKEAINKGNTDKQLKVDVTVRQEDVVTAINRSTEAIVAATAAAGRFA